MTGVLLCIAGVFLAALGRFMSSGRMAQMAAAQDEARHRVSAFIGKNVLAAGIAALLCGILALSVRGIDDGVFALIALACALLFGAIAHFGSKKRG